MSLTRRSDPPAADAGAAGQAAEIRTGTFMAGASGVRLHVAQAGSDAAPAMLLLHGFPEHWITWQAMMPALAQTRRVVAPDQRGVNLSDKPAPTGAYEPRELVADAVALIDALNADAGAHADPARRCVLVGHDWGGAVAWNVAIQHPERIAALVILNAPHPWKFWHALAFDAEQQRASAYMNWLRKPGSEAALTDRDFARLDGFFMNLGGGAWFRGALRSAYHAAWSQPGALTASLNWYRASPLHPPQPGDPGAAALALDADRFVVRVPTLVLWGERDPALPASLLDGLERFVPDLRIERLPECTHWLTHERAALLAERIAAFAPPPG